jgi:hypothetical protein
MLFGIIVGWLQPLHGGPASSEPHYESFRSSIGSYDLGKDTLAAAMGIGQGLPRGSQQKVSLGSAASSNPAWAGVYLEGTWDDWQYNIKGRRVDFGTKPYIHFAYTDRQYLYDASNRMGYNVYDPIGYAWPRGQWTGCEVQGTFDTGYNVTMDVSPNNRVVLAGEDNWNEYGYGTDNHFYFQPSTPFSCNWGYGSYITSSQYWYGR